MSWRAVIFDLDGTLLDTIEDIAAAANHALARRGFPPCDLSDYRRFVGEGARVLISRVLPESARGEESVRASLADFMEEYARSWYVRTLPYQGIAAMLEDCAQKKIAMGVLSNKPHELTVKCVEAAFGHKRFKIVLGQRPQVPRKPDPAGAFEAARSLGVEPRETLFVGDSAIDMQTARAAGMRAVGALWGYRDREELLAAGAQELAAHPTDILRLI